MNYLQKYGFALCFAPLFLFSNPQEISWENPSVTASNEQIILEEESRNTPTDFIRDIMQPIGMPVVSIYHTARESLFLNTRVSQANPIEAIGDFFLVPSRYLFAGKKIYSEDNHYRVKQSYSYKRLHWLKSIGAITALPVSYTVGCALKGVSYLFPEVRRRQRAIKRAFSSASTQNSNREKYKIQGIEHFHSDGFIPCQGHQRPSRLTKKQKVEIQALKEIIALFEKHDILYWIDCGSCLGAYRYGGIIPWDWDIDLSILADDHENVKRLLSTLDPKKYQIQDWSSYSKPQTFLKLYVKETKNFVDIYHYQINEKEQTLGYIFTYIDSPFPKSWKESEMRFVKPLPYDLIFPLKKAQFDHLTVWAPHNTEVFLQSRYGQDLSPSMVWNEKLQDYTKVIDHPYHQ